MSTSPSKNKKQFDVCFLYAESVYYNLKGDAPAEVVEGYYRDMQILVQQFPEELLFAVVLSRMALLDMHDCTVPKLDEYIDECLILNGFFPNNVNIPQNLAMLLLHRSNYCETVESRTIYIEKLLSLGIDQPLNQVVAEWLLKGLNNLLIRLKTHDEVNKYLPTARHVISNFPDDIAFKNIFIDLLGELTKMSFLPESLVATLTLEKKELSQSINS